MRILLLTDSLGCPRPEIPVEKTWTYNIMESWHKNYVFYTWCKHGLDSNDICVSINDIREIEPDIIICQIGIVDACRRALSKRELRLIARLPGVLRNGIRKFAEKNHYILTKKRNIHYNLPEKLVESIKLLIDTTKEKVIWIPIFGGVSLEKKTFNLANDIKDYNRSVAEIDDEKLIIINPFREAEIEEILLADGHHLNFQGNKLVYKAINKLLIELENELKDG